MNTVIKPTLLAGLGILSLGATFGGMNADAAELRTNANIRMEKAQEINQDRRYIEGHYEVRTEQVLVSPERKEYRTIPAVTETRYPKYGPPMTVVVRPATTSEICIPAQYKTVETRVWVPGYYVNNHSGFQDRDHDGRNDRFEDDKGRIHDGPAFPDRDHDGRNDRFEDDKGRIHDGPATGRNSHVEGQIDTGKKGTFDFVFNWFK